MGEPQHLRAGGQHHEGQEICVRAHSRGEAEYAAPDRFAGGRCVRLLARGGKEREPTKQEAEGDGEVGDTGAEVRDDGAGAERAHQPAGAHADAEHGQALEQRRPADDIVRVALARGMLEAAQRAGGQREHQQMAKRHDPEDRERAERAGGERLAEAGHHQQATPRDAIGQRARRRARRRRAGARACSSPRRRGTASWSAPARPSRARRPRPSCPPSSGASRPRGTGSRAGGRDRAGECSMYTGTPTSRSMGHNWPGPLPYEDRRWISRSPTPRLSKAFVVKSAPGWRPTCRRASRARRSTTRTA